jgi:hypothetical protein
MLNGHGRGAVRDSVENDQSSCAMTTAVVIQVIHVIWDRARCLGGALV